MNSADVAKIARALPERLTPACRQRAAESFADDVELWNRTASKVSPYRESARDLAHESALLRKRLKKTLDKVRRSWRVSGAAAAEVGTAMPFELEMIVHRTLGELDRWDRLWRPGRGAPQDFAQSIIQRLEQTWRLIIGDDLAGFDHLLGELPKAAPWLPVLNRETITGRRRRATKSPKK